MNKFRLLYEVLSDRGLIDNSSTSLTNFPVESIQNSESIPYRAVSGTTAFIRGSFASPYKYYRSNQFLIDTFFLAHHNCPVGTVVTFKLYTAQTDLTPVYSSTKTITSIADPVWQTIETPVLAAIYEVSFTFPSSHSLEIYRVMVGHSWVPTFNHTNDYTVPASVVDNKPFRLRNGGIRLEERTVYKALDLTVTNQSSSSMGEFADICFHYGNFSDMAIILQPLNMDGFGVESAFVGRMLRWTEPVLSNAGYRWGFTVEELKL